MQSSGRQSTNVWPVLEYVVWFANGWGKNP